MAKEKTVTKIKKAKLGDYFPKFISLSQFISHTVFSNGKSDSSEHYCEAGRPPFL